MSDFRPPVADMMFVLEHVVGLVGLLDRPEFEHVDGDTVGELLAEAGRFMAEQLEPLDEVGDREGSRLENGRVITPTGFAGAYSRFVEAGWNSISFDPAYDGGGLPWVVGLAVQELMTAANMGFGLCPILTQSAVELLDSHADEEQKETWLRPLVSGEWTGTMNLTEPQAGSDLGAMTTRAEPAGDGTWRIRGTKIFITYGDHEMAENIVHLVQARTPDAPPGTRGISCFIVPKFLLDDDGRPGTRNDVSVVSLEHKLGIHASPTCVMAFGENEGAVGYLIGEVNQGMKYMFTMMNSARLSIGLQGLGVAERSYQLARDYALERRQGRALGSDTAPGESSPIVEHGDVRRMLMTMRSQIEAMRCVMYANAVAMDWAGVHPDPEERRRFSDLSALLTPISKGWGTELGVELSSLAIQVHGGAGYIEETGVARHWRDSRIAPIYEGTNGIQALDLVFRKVNLDGGLALDELMESVVALTSDLRSGELRVMEKSLADAVAVVAPEIEWVRARLTDDPVQVGIGAVAFMEMLGTLVGGFYMARSALVAQRLLATDGGDRDFLADKIVSAAFYCEEILPRVHGLAPRVRTGDEVVFGIDPSRL